MNKPLKTGGIRFLDDLFKKSIFCTNILSSVFRIKLSLNNGLERESPDLKFIILNAFIIG